MSDDPATNPNHELDLQPQDLEGMDPDIPLARVVALLRVLGGEGGHAEVRWFRGGHWHVISTTRGGDEEI